MDEFRAYRLYEGEDGSRPRGRIDTLSVDELSAGDVVVRVAYCALNHKAALANAGVHRLIRSYPRIGGAEIIGFVESSDDPRFRHGDLVQSSGHSVGIDHDGGFAQYARLRAEWLLPLGARTDPFEAAAIGGNGLCAAMAIRRMEETGLAPSSGPVIVTGATGGVSTLAIQMLSRLGYDVCALTGKPHAAEVLRKLGAAQIIDANSLTMGQRPLESARWAGAIDSVGGATLSWLTRTMQPGGTIASIGNAGGASVDTTVMPFILRGITLIGIAAYPLALREQLWERIWAKMRPLHLRELTRVIGLDELPANLDAMLARQTIGRILLKPDLGRRPSSAQ